MNPVIAGFLKISGNPNDRSVTVCARHGCLGSPRNLAFRCTSATETETSREAGSLLTLTTHSWKLSGARKASRRNPPPPSNSASAKEPSRTESEPGFECVFSRFWLFSTSFDGTLRFFRVPFDTFILKQERGERTKRRAVSTLADCGLAATGHCLRTNRAERFLPSPSFYIEAVKTLP